MVRQKLGQGTAQDAERAGVIVDAEAPLAGARFIHGNRQAHSFRRRRSL